MASKTSRKKTVVPINKTKAIPYPMFEKCKKYTLDFFWISIFDKCAKGNLQSPISGFNPKTYEVVFTYTVRNKKQTLTAKPSKRNSLGLFKLVKEYFHRFGIFSTSEIPTANYPFMQYTKWNFIKSKAVKEELVSNYLQKKYPNNSPDKFYEVMSLIQIKHITANDIKLMDGKIVNIDIKPIKETQKESIFPKYEYNKKTNLLSQSVIKYSKERCKTRL